MTPASSLGPASRRTGSLLILLSGAVLLAVIALLLLRLSTDRNPAEGSAEVGFARDMLVHHSQAVEMALLLYDRTENPILRAIALDMLLTQQAQIGQMQGWLTLWNRPIASIERPMTWMDMPTDGLMPGMATAQQIEALRSAAGVEADRQFISLMIPHHEGGIHMAQAVLQRTDVPVVRALADSIIAAQQREIDELKELAARINS